MSETIIKTIHKVRVSGRWVEFWFKENLSKDKNYKSEWGEFIGEECFHACVKISKLFQVLNEKENEPIREEMVAAKLKNIKTVWVHSHFKGNLEFVSFLEGVRTVLIEKK